MIPCDILIVEDDDDIRQDLASILIDEGYATVAASNGQAALDRLGEPNLPRLILLDLMMPSMSGWDFRVRQLADPSIANIPVVIMSGAANVVRTATSLKAAGFLTKPFKLADLLETIGKFCPKADVLPT
jgi:CheY-like chemotaxis protein